MTYTDNLWLFFTLLFGIIVVPGMDMVLVMSKALTRGRRAGLMATAGIMAGGLVHALYAVIGVSALIRFLPGLFDALLLAGAVYIGWIGLSLLRSSSRLGAVNPAAAVSDGVSFRQGALTSLLNPKAYLFMLAVFPQFLKPQYGGLWSQAAVMSAMTAATQLGVYGAIALAAGRSRTLISGHPQATTVIGRLVGGFLLLVAILTAWGALQALQAGQAGQA